MNELPGMWEEADLSGGESDNAVKPKMPDIEDFRYPASYPKAHYGSTDERGYERALRQYYKDLSEYYEACAAQAMKFSRTWAMPNHDTFSVKPIGEFVQRYMEKSVCSIDPFARNKDWATYTNDLNPETTAQYHMDAEMFLHGLADSKVKADLVLFDPPYSPRQISECYKSIGMEVGMKETQSALLYKRVRDALMPVLAPGAIVLSFGWNTVGMGKGRGFELIEIMLCCHGGAHNDTICIAEKKK